MSEKKLPINDILKNWKANCGVESRNGKRIIIPVQDRMQHMLNLIKTMVDNHGYTKEELESKILRGRIVTFIWPDDVKPPKGLPYNRLVTANQWEEAVCEFFKTPILIHTRDERVSINIKSVQKSENNLELEPKDRIKMDISDMAEVPYDDEILAELAAIGTVLGGKDE